MIKSYKRKPQASKYNAAPPDRGRNGRLALLSPTREPVPIHNRITPRSGRREPPVSHNRSGRTTCRRFTRSMKALAAFVNLFIATEYFVIAGLAAIAWRPRRYMTLQSEERVLSASRRHSPGTEHWP